MLGTRLIPAAVDCTIQRSRASALRGLQNVVSRATSNSPRADRGPLFHQERRCFGSEAVSSPASAETQRSTSCSKLLYGGIGAISGAGALFVWQYYNSEQAQKKANSQRLAACAAPWFNRKEKQEDPAQAQEVAKSSPTLSTPDQANNHSSRNSQHGQNGLNGHSEHNGHRSGPLWRSEESRPLEKKMEETAIFSGSSNIDLAKDIAECLHLRLGDVKLKRFADGEVSLQFLDSLRGKDVYIVQPTSPPVNEHLMELLLMISTCRRSSAKKITAVIPYYGYARQDRKLSSRVPISAADVARMIEAMGVDRVISVDLHCGQIQGFFGPRVPVDNLEAQLIGLRYFVGKDLSRPVVVSPDAGGVYRARKFQEGLLARGISDVGIAMLIKQRARANEIERMDLVGSVEGCDVVIVDDMIDTAGTLCEAAKELRKKGAKRVFAFATHGLFSGPAMTRIQKSELEEVVVTDSIVKRAEFSDCHKIKHLKIAPLIADAIRRIHQKESLQQLFTPSE